MPVPGSEVARKVRFFRRRQVELHRAQHPAMEADELPPERQKKPGRKAASA
jgi:hypothetical protein